MTLDQAAREVGIRYGVDQENDSSFDGFLDSASAQRMSAMSK
jgi:hypothetical protein